MTPPSRLCIALLARRTELDITQDTAAKLIGVWPSMYSRWEKGQVVPRGSVDLIAEFLNIPAKEVRQLMGPKK